MRSNVQGSGKPQSTNPPAGPGNAAEAAWAELRQALAKKAVEPICAAYLNLRRACPNSPGKELLGRLTATAGPEAVSVLVSAFGHRRCYMCEDGTSVCPTCDGTGIQDGEPCRQCKGLGLEPCSFCDARGWMDLAQIPPELAGAVRQHHLSHLDKSIQRLAKTMANGAWSQAKRLPADKRRELAGWLVRLKARCEAVGSESPSGDGRAGRYRALAVKLPHFLNKLRQDSASAAAAPKPDKPYELSEDKEEP